KDQVLTVTAGDGVVEVRDPAKGWVLVTKEFRLKRGGKEVVRVRRQELALVRDRRTKDLNPPAARPHPDQPFVVARRGGGNQEFKSSAAALAARREGDAIEVHGSGPFTVPALQGDAKGLVLRAAPGCRPVFVAEVEAGAGRPWLAVPGGEVLVEGCDF